MYTYLEILNYVLAQTGMAPVVTSDLNFPLVASAKARILEAQRWLNSKSYWYNEDLCVTIDVDGYDEIVLPTGTMKINRAEPRFLVPRGGKAYDPYTQTNKFPDLTSVTLDLTMDVPVEDMPSSAQDAVRFAAAREHILAELEDSAKAAQLDEALLEARIQVNKDDLTVKRRNALVSPSAIRMRGAVRPYNRGRTVNPYIPGGR